MSGRTTPTSIKGLQVLLLLTHLQLSARTRTVLAPATLRSSPNTMCSTGCCSTGCCSVVKSKTVCCTPCKTVCCSPCKTVCCSPCKTVCCSPCKTVCCSPCQQSCCCDPCKKTVCCEPCQSCCDPCQKPCCDPCQSCCDPCQSCCDPCQKPCCDPCQSCCDPCQKPCCDPCQSCCDPCQKPCCDPCQKPCCDPCQTCCDPCQKPCCDPCQSCCDPCQSVCCTKVCHKSVCCVPRPCCSPCCSCVVKKPVVVCCTPVRKYCTPCIPIQQCCASLRKTYIPNTPGSLLTCTSGDQEQTNTPIFLTFSQFAPNAIPTERPARRRGWVWAPALIQHQLLLSQFQNISIHPADTRPHFLAPSQGCGEDKFIQIHRSPLIISRLNHDEAEAAWWITSNEAKCKFQATPTAKKYGFGWINREAGMVNGCLTSRRKDGREYKRAPGPARFIRSPSPPFTSPHSSAGSASTPTTPKMPNGCCGCGGGNNYTVCCYSSPRCCKTPMCCSPMQCCSPCCMPMQSCCMPTSCCYTISSNNNSGCCGGCCGGN
ncbi:LOW QUALITY PROTEIN: keratin-associated protein 10-4-like [Serinus canaria]|nr:LOW QUALITY PROTEIN: keratin-associated protein 10-4-like [Serinus canaria]